MRSRFFFWHKFAGLNGPFVSAPLRPQYWRAIAQSHICFSVVGVCMLFIIDSRVCGRGERQSGTRAQMTRPFIGQNLIRVKDGRNIYFGCEVQKFLMVMMSCVFLMFRIREGLW